MRRLIPTIAALTAVVTGSSAIATESGVVPVPPPTATLTVDSRDAGTAFPHFWEDMFGSGRAVLALRDDYRNDVRLVRAATGLHYLRFHGILDDDVGVYDLDESGQAHYNFSYVDAIYDGLLAEGIRPFVELSFMPRKLARNPDQVFGFWNKPNISPPGDYARWDAMISAFTRHLVERYGLDEVAQWYFEVWNEPNIGFWGGQPYQSTYFELYDHTARAIKSVSERLRVGGPSSAQAGWAGDFIRHCHDNQVPLDFVSSHVYANDTPEDVFKNKVPVPRDQMVCRAVRKVSDEIRASPLPNAPLVMSEYNASFANEPDVTDSVYMGPWLATTISQCDGLVRAMSYWTFSDVFDEGGVFKTPFYGGFGIIAPRDIPKPAYNAFAVLHRLGSVRLPVNSDSALVTRRNDGSLAVALWYYADPDGTGEKYTAPKPPGPARHFLLEIGGLAPGARARLWRVDADHGNVLKAFDAMGRPAAPSREQLDVLRASAVLPRPEHLRLSRGRLELDVPRHGLALVEIR